MSRPFAAILIAILSLLNACVTQKATGFATPRERVDECVQLCEGVGLKMTAMVVIMSNSGCVCGVKSEEKSGVPSAQAGAVSGGALIAAAAEASRQQAARTAR